MKKRLWIALSLLLSLGLLFGLGLIFAHRPVTIRVGGEVLWVDTLAWTSGWALHDAGVTLGELDEVVPPLEAGLPWSGALVEVLRPRVVSLWQDGAALKTWWTRERRSDRLLAEAGVTLAEGDQLLWNGAPVALEQALPAEGDLTLQVRAAQVVTVRSGTQQKTVRVLGPALGAALWSAGLAVTPLDLLSSPYSATLAQARDLTLKPALALRIRVDGKELLARSAAATVGQALAQAGVALQGLDYAIPAENQPLPADGLLRVVRVSESIELQQTLLPYKNEMVADPTIELDQQRIVEAGQPGVQVKRVRVRFEDGKEVSRQAEAEWLASAPRSQKTGYGTKIVVRSLDTPDGPIQYWRKVTVYATSYAPCNFLQTIGQCSYSTAAGYPLQKGVIGVGEAWYQLFKGWGMYVDGYGPAKVGDYGYIPGFWVDLGYSDADFINWHRNTTLYFLTPVPANVPWILPK